MGRGLEEAISAALERHDRLGTVSDDWLRRSFPDHWEDVRRLLDVDAGLTGGLPVGERVGPYEIRQHLGSGGMGRVFLAEAVEKAGDVRSGECVALKVLHAHLAERPALLERFEREAAAGRRVHDDGVVSILDVRDVERGGETLHTLAMARIRGKTLRQVVHERGPLPEAACFRIACDAARALAAVHAQQIVHRDVKPSNLMLTDQGRLVLLDLGVAWLQDELVRLSRTGEFVGSFLYAAPEQFFGKHGPLDGRADLYALGVTLFELATGELPWDQGTTASNPQLRWDFAPRRAEEFRADLSPRFQQLLDRLLATDVCERPASAAHLAAELADAVRGEESIQDLLPVPGAPALATSPRIVGLGRLRRALGEARHGRGTTVLVVGPEGAGKSHLLERFRQRLSGASRRWRVLFGRYSNDEDGLLAALGGGIDVGDTNNAAGAHDRRQSAVLRTLRELGNAAPAVIIVDNLDVADRTARALFSSAARAVAGERMLLLGALKGDDAAEWVAGLERGGAVSVIHLGERLTTTVASLDALEPADRELLVHAARLGTTFAPQDLATVASLSLRQTLRALARIERDHGLIRFAEERVGFRAAATVRALTRPTAE